MTAVMRLRPFGGLEAGFESAFDDLVRRTMGDTGAATWTPAADVTREGEDALITLELPGIAPGDLEIEVKDRALIVTGSREVTQRSEQDEAGVHVLRREIRRGEFSRTFRLPAHVGPDAVEASYDQGMLTIRIRGAQPAPVSRRVPIANLADPSSAVESTDGAGAA